MTSPLHHEELTVHVVTTGSPDADGVATSTRLLKPWGPCNVQQASTTELRGGREVTTTRLRANGPLAEWIGEGDKITRRGVDYRVDGEPAHFVSGALDHTEVTLVKWTGV